MSYVKAGVVKDGEFNVVEVHGSELTLDVTTRNHFDMDNEEYIDIPDFDDGEEYEKWCRENGIIPSGIVRERFNEGIPVVFCEEEKEKWLERLKRCDIRERADRNPDGYKFNSIVDLDNDLFISMEENWFKHYDKSLPMGWKYVELPAKVMNKLYYDWAREKEEYEAIKKGKEPHLVKKPEIRNDQEAVGLTQVSDIPRPDEELEIENHYYLACPEHGQKLAFTNYYAKKELAEDDIEKFFEWFCFGV